MPFSGRSVRTLSLFLNEMQSGMVEEGLDNVDGDISNVGDGDKNVVIGDKNDVNLDLCNAHHSHSSGNEIGRNWYRSRTWIWILTWIRFVNQSRI